MPQAKGLERVKVKTKAEIEDDFRQDLMRMLLHMRYTTIEVDLFRENTLVKTSPGQLGSYAGEVSDELRKIARKFTWFIGAVKKILGTKTEAFLNQELDPNGHKIANIAQLTEWVAFCSRDLSNDVDVIVNGSRRKELFRDAWKTAVTETTDRPWSAHDEIRFNSWYNTKFSSST